MDSYECHLEGIILLKKPTKILKKMTPADQESVAERCLKNLKVADAQEANSDEEIKKVFITKDTIVNLDIGEGALEIKRMGYSWCVHPYRNLCHLSVLGREGHLVYFGRDTLTASAIALVVRMACFETACHMTRAFQTKEKEKKSKSETNGEIYVSKDYQPPPKPPRVSPVGEGTNEKDLSGSPQILALKYSVSSNRSSLHSLMNLNGDGKSQSTPDLPNITVSEAPESDHSRFYIPSQLLRGRRSRIETPDLLSKSVSTESIGNRSVTTRSPTPSIVFSQSKAIALEDPSKRFMVDMQTKFQDTFSKLTPNKNKKALAMEIQKQKECFLKSEEEYLANLKELATLDVSGENQKLLKALVISVESILSLQNSVMRDINIKDKLMLIIEAFLNRWDEMQRCYLAYSRSYVKVRKYESNTLHLSQFLKVKLTEINERMSLYNTVFHSWKSYLKESEKDRVLALLNDMENYFSKLQYLLTVDSVRNSAINLEKHIPVIFNEEFMIRGDNFNADEVYKVLILNSTVIVIARIISEEDVEFLDAFCMDQITVESFERKSVEMRVNYGLRRGSEVLVLREMRREAAEEVRQVIEASE